MRAAVLAARKGFQLAGIQGQRLATPVSVAEREGAPLWFRQKSWAMAARVQVRTESMARMKDARAVMAYR